MFRHCRQMYALFLVLLLLIPAAGQGSVLFPAETEGQRKLADYVSLVNENLLSQGEQEINSLFECYRSFADFGITDQDGALMPEEVEVHVTLYADGINVLTLDVSNLDRFPAIAAAFLQAASPGSVTLSDAKATPEAKAARARKSPESSFGDDITELNGTTVYAYYTYMPNRYSDGVSWIELTLVFPLPGYEDTGIRNGSEHSSEKDLSYNEDIASDYASYFSEDNYSHFTVQVTATPEPDSAAHEQMEKW